MTYSSAPSLELNAKWQSSIESLSQVTQSNGLLKQVEPSNKCLCEFKSFVQNESFEVALPEAMSSFAFPHLNAVPVTAEQTFFCFAPIWGENQNLFAVLVMSSRSIFREDDLRSIESTAGRISFDVCMQLGSAQQSQPAQALATIKDKVAIESARAPTLQEFIDALDDHTWIKNVDGHYVMINDSVMTAWNYTKAHVYGKTDLELFDEKRAQMYTAADQTVIDKNEQVVIEECPVLDENQEKIWLETIKSPIRNDSGELIGVLGMTRNVTRRKVVETWLSVSGEIFDNFQEGMMITDSTGNILDVNSAFVRITGYTLSDVLGKNPRFLQSGHHNLTFYQNMWRNLVSSGQWKGEFINRKKDGSLYPQMTTISTIMDEENALMHHICVFEDISAQKADEENLRKMAFYDPLTNLPNRSHIGSLLVQHIETGHKHQKQFATLFLDLDHFKHINDSKGHLYGDRLLEQVADRLSQVLEHKAHIGRIGGDEFVIVLSDFESEDELLDYIDSIMGVFNPPFMLEAEDSLRVSASIGVALYPKDGTSSEVLLKNADTAMYLAKKNGRNGYAFYSPDLTYRSVLHVRIQSALHDALEKNQFYLAYQPQYSLVDHSVVGVEALLRWQHPELGLISPLNFIPIAEKTGLIQKIGTWVLRESCIQGTRWLAEGKEFGRIAVNVSALQLQNLSFFSVLKQILKETGFPPERLDIEITESFLLFDPEKAIAALEQLSLLGIEISLDDFGTGYSSLSYLKGLPINKLKIDQSFVKDVPENGDSNAIVNAIIAMGQALSLKVVAEGVESWQQADYLNQRGCQYGQGYVFSRPQKPEALFT
ncbi:EAL domain-containing protein [Vibrio sp. 10N.261.51.F12]|uniref:sensor domain-containing protein n=1 Tax=Vibrio sp. 10N.261.51.F12 TaxID=3229679 RepID=UPI003556971B